jgi:MFS family permease
LGIWAARRIEDPSSGVGGSPWPISAFRAALGSYFLFGVGYIAYMTFVVAWMVSHGASALDVALTWGTLGVATMLAPIVWRAPRSRWHPAKTLAAVGVVISVGVTIPLRSTSLPAMILSAFFFGAAMFTAPAAVTDLVKSALPKAAWGSAVAVFTVLFAIGQSIGPVVTGLLADATHSLKAGLAGSVVILLSAGAAAMCQRISNAERVPARQRAARWRIDGTQDLMPARGACNKRNKSDLSLKFSCRNCLLNCNASAPHRRLVQPSWLTVRAIARSHSVPIT